MPIEFEHQQVGDLDLRIATSRRGHDVTLLLTNALPQSIRCWESLWDRLAERFDLVAVDLPGFGGSTGSGEVMRPSAHAEVLVELLDVLDIDEVFLVGPDIGVPVTLFLAAQHPQRVIGVNVFDGPAVWPPDFDAGLRAATRSRLVRWLALRPPMRGRLMRQNVRTATSDGYRRFTPSVAAADEYRAIAADRRIHRNTVDFLGSYGDELPRLEAMLPTIDVPVLITWGADDPFVLPSNAERIAGVLPNSEVRIFAGSGHFSHEDADDEWLDCLVRFVEQATTIHQS